MNSSVKELEYPEYASVRKFDKYNVDLSLSENILCSESVLEVLRNSDRIYVNKYKFARDPELLELISEKLDISSDNILITAGCDYALHHIAETFLEKGDKTIIPCPSFCRYEFHAKIQGAKPIFIKFSKPPNNIDLRILKNHVAKLRPKLIFLANPNNPTGQLVPKEEIVEFVSEVECVVVVDEALIDYLPKKASCAELIDYYPNLVVTRSFSKFYGLAGVRIGYIIANREIIKHISKTISPFEVSSISIELAKAVLQDSKFQSYVRKTAKKCVEFMRRNSPLKISDTTAAVALLYGGKQIPKLHEVLLGKGILTVNGKILRGLEKLNCVRISLHSLGDLKILVETIRSVINEKFS